jgi:hypothetical protein
LIEMAVRSMETAETAMETDGDGSGGTSLSRQGAETETSVPRNSSTTAAELRNYFWKIAESPILSRQGVYVGEREDREGAWGLLTQGWRSQGWAAPPMCVSPLRPFSVSSSGSVGLLVKYDFW